MDFGGCGLVHFGFPLLDEFVERVHGSGEVGMVGGGGRVCRDAFIFLTRAEEVGCDGVVILW